jgi:hypothetical protein
MKDKQKYEKDLIKILRSLLFSFHIGWVSRFIQSKSCFTCPQLRRKNLIQIAHRVLHGHLKVLGEKYQTQADCGSSTAQGCKAFAASDMSRGQTPLEKCHCQLQFTMPSRWPSTTRHSSNYKRCKSCKTRKPWENMSCNYPKYSSQFFDASSVHLQTEICSL